MRDEGMSMSYEGWGMRTVKTWRGASARRALSSFILHPSSFNSGGVRNV